MRRGLWTSAAVFALLAGLSIGSPAVAQEPPPEPRPASFGVAPPEGDGLLTPEELDALVAPVALYPDSLLTQVLVAATYPLEIIKADRFLTENAALEDKARAELTEQEDWDPSVQVLAAGFPDVVQRMATEVDWTEQLGDAMVAQTDELLDAIQRQRARAVAIGNLTTNEAQVVDEEGENISIAPANPDVVYVPSYDATSAFTTPYTNPAYIDTGYSTGDIIATGAIAFGGAMLLNEIFEDDDDWNGYWGGSPSVDWDDGEFYPRRGGINADGDVNIDVDRNRVRVDGGDRNRVERIGDTDRVRGERGDAWKPTADQKNQARDKIAARESTGGAKRVGAQDKIKARSPADSGGREKLQAATEKREAQGKPPVAQANRKPAAANTNFSAFNQKERLDAGKSKQAVNRGSASKSKAGKVSTAKPKSVTRSTASRPPPKKSVSRSSTFKPSGSGSKVKASKSRANKSSGGRSRGGGGGGGGVRRR